MKKFEEMTIKELCDYRFKDKKLILPIGWTDDIFYKNFQRIAGLFIAGSTGTGKSVFIDDLIVSLMYKNNPEEVKFVMFDPKKIELGEYDGIKYLLTGNSHYDLKKSSDALLFILDVLESRVNTLKKMGCKSIEDYNQKNNEKWPHIFLFVDEGSILVRVKYAKMVFDRVLECGNLIGIHLIYATNSYLKDDINNDFVNRFKYRISFDLTSEEEAKAIKLKNASWLNGGEAIIMGRSGEKYRIKAPYVKDDEINEFVSNNQN